MHDEQISNMNNRIEDLQTNTDQERLEGNPPSATTTGPSVPLPLDCQPAWGGPRTVRPSVATLDAQM